MSFGQVVLGQGVTADLALAEVPDDLKGKVSLDSVNNITVDTGIIAGSYNFKVKISGTGNYSGEIEIPLTLFVDIKQEIKDFLTLPSTSMDVTEGYLSEESYGQVVLSQGATADLSLIEVPDDLKDKVSLDSVNNITVAKGLTHSNEPSNNTYTFKLKVTGTGDYKGEVITDFTLNIGPKIRLTADHFTVTDDDVVAVIGYSVYDYGQIILKENVNANFEIGEVTYGPLFTIGDKPPYRNKLSRHGFRVNANGEITEHNGIGYCDSRFCTKVGDDIFFKVKITGYGSYYGTVEKEFKFKNIYQQIPLQPGDFSARVVVPADRIMNQATRTLDGGKTKEYFFHIRQESFFRYDMLQISFPSVLNGQLERIFVRSNSSYPGVNKGGVSYIGVAASGGKATVYSINPNNQGFPNDYHRYFLYSVDVKFIGTKNYTGTITYRITVMANKIDAKEPQKAPWE